MTRFHKHRYNGKQYKFLYSQNDGFSLGETGDWSCHVFTLNAAKRPVYIVSNASIYQRTVDGTVEMLTCGANQRECDADCGKQGICCEHKITFVKSCRCESGFSGASCDTISRSSLSIPIILLTVAILFIVICGVCLLKKKKRTSKKETSDKNTETIALNET